MTLLNTAESADRLLGKINNKTWYQVTPSRLKEERKRMRILYPNFKFSFQKDKSVVWEGSVGFNDENGRYKFPKLSYNPLKIKIVCPKDYPSEFPSVVDVEGILINEGCRHIMEGNRICYALRPSTELNFNQKHYIADLIPVIQAFLLKWYCKERTGIWPGGEHPHGPDAIILWEMDHGEIDAQELCPCTQTNDTYQGHCLKLVQKRLAYLRSKFPLLVIRRYPERNQPCLCGSGKKYKKCGLLEKCPSGKKVRIYSLNPNASEIDVISKLNPQT